MRRIRLAKTRRYRLTKLLVPAFLVLYIAMIPLHSVLETEHGEIFPFFRWKLFSHIPDWQSYDYGLVVDAIDGQPTSGVHFLIPNPDIRDWKALRLAVSACAAEIDCDETVAEVLYPIVHQNLGDRSVDFSIVRTTADLHDVQANIDGLVDGTTTRADLTRPTRVLSRWNTETGRIVLAQEAGR